MSTYTQIKPFKKNLRKKNFKNFKKDYVVVR